ncbi:Uncharacterised protein [Algoriella xinjiangensis]|uniref:HEPN/Toprim-associated domain-containing protein n=1 Tax=Algoriella xinjiangensis TaxID=684065 RepID=UPI000F63AFD8|nr:HEPN/Toprim-associated domain-containing protein [Algoriella xinjiangensis]VDH16694.1 Uncharacterised protein [Algoriella xinjiangensis]
MGSYSQITFADYPVFDNKNWYNQDIVNLLFQPNDFVSVKMKYSSRNKIIWGDAYKNEDGYFEFKGYKQSVKICKKRLEIYGTSYKKAKIDYATAKKISREECFYSFSLNNFSYEQYLAEIKSIFDSKEIDYHQLFTNFRDSLLAGDLGIYGQSLDCQLYSILSVLPEDAIIEYDLTDVISGGWVKEEQVKEIDFEKIIILTEGKTDVEFISKSIEKLYPYLKNYYHFIDFDEHKIESNASALVKLIKSFSAANVKHPIIALFDNDTTGLMEMRNLISKSLPNNIKILKYPDIDLAKKYPTIGPTGNKKMNVNSFACGIEMYLGKDVLTKNDAFIPVCWKGFNDKENKYQGEIAEKKFVQEIFRAKLIQNKSNEFTEMDILLNEIFNAYKIK